RFSERLSALERLEPTGVGVAPGTAIELMDRIQTRNDFHGGEFGFSWLRGRNCWSAEATGLLGLGWVGSRYTLDGQTSTYIGNRLLSSYQGGFLVRPEHIGSYRKSRFALMPQMRLNLRYQWNECVHTHVGYEFLYLRPTVRPGTLASTRFDGTTLGADPGSIMPTDPSPSHDDLFVHGFNLGLTLTW
ncbi:MAG: BBP7 family outer membrane beta-barrel protein, partial [Planctomycetota bacterium]